MRGERERKVLKKQSAEREKNLVGWLVVFVVVVGWLIWLWLLVFFVCFFSQGRERIAL